MGIALDDIISHYVCGCTFCMTFIVCCVHCNAVHSLCGVHTHILVCLIKYCGEFSINFHFSNKCADIFQFKLFNADNSKLNSFPRHRTALYQNNV